VEADDEPPGLVRTVLRRDPKDVLELDSLFVVDLEPPADDLTGAVGRTALRGLPELGLDLRHGGFDLAQDLRSHPGVLFREVALDGSVLEEQKEGPEHAYITDLRLFYFPSG
jgi:hypothetical protein